jgi:transposase
VSEYVRRARAAGIGWPLPEGMHEVELDRRLFPPLPSPARAPRPEPDWSEVHRELKRKGVTLSLLWEEYKAGCPEGYRYSWFCETYREWAGRLDLVMRQTHRAGEKLFVDYAGPTVEVIDRKTGEVREAQIFVCVLGASNYTYAEATWTQQLPDWIGSHVRAFRFFGGVPEILVPDNLTSGVTRPHRYEPLPNATYRDMAAHFGCAIIPARVRRPRDKAKVEAGVLLVERWILARLRHRKFFSLIELNVAIAEALEALNARPFKKLEGSRRSLFEALDRPALKSLPTSPYEFGEWSTARVHIDYHVEVERHYYSVPYQLFGQKLDVWCTARVVEMYGKGVRVASHVRTEKKGGFTTLKEHMPPSHRAHAEWTPERLVGWARKTGESTAGMAAVILESRAHPQQGFRSCLGLISLGKKHGADRLEAACRRALEIGASSYRSVESILKNGLERRDLALRANVAETPTPLEFSVEGEAGNGRGIDAGWPGCGGRGLGEAGTAAVFSGVQASDREGSGLLQGVRRRGCASPA